jgi:hypothetical protein
LPVELSFGRLGGGTDLVGAEQLLFQGIHLCNFEQDGKVLPLSIPFHHPQALGPIARQQQPVMKDAEPTKHNHHTPLAARGSPAGSFSYILLMLLPLFSGRRKEGAGAFTQKPAGAHA